MEDNKIKISGLYGEFKSPIVVGGTNNNLIKELAKGVDHSIRELSMFQNFGGRPMSRGWITPPQGKHHSANKTKKKVRKAQRQARRINR